MNDRNMVSRAFHASKFTQMLRYRDETGGIVRRFIHPTMGVMYEVRLIPQGVQNAQPKDDENHA
jgi:hypothetical protein